MKKFTAKEFHQRPADVYEAAREYGKCEVTHGQHRGVFTLSFVKTTNKDKHDSYNDMLKFRMELLKNDWNELENQGYVFSAEHCCFIKKPSEEGQITGE